MYIKTGLEGEESYEVIQNSSYVLLDEKVRDHEISLRLKSYRVVIPGLETK